MAIISNVLLVLFIISAILMTLLVIFQDDQGDGIGGLFSSGSSPFRSRSGNLLQHMTTAVAIFFCNGTRLRVCHEASRSLG